MGNVINCKICNSIFIDMDGPGSAEEVYKKHLTYCRPVKIKRVTRWRDYRNGKNEQVESKG